MMCALHIPTVPYLPYRSGHCAPERRLLERRPSRPHERFLPVRVPHWTLHSVSPGVSGDSLPEGSEHPPRHVWQVPEIDIACISRSGLRGVPCRIEPASRWWWASYRAGLNKLAQGTCSSEVRKRRSPVLGRILQSVRQLHQATNAAIVHGSRVFPLPGGCARHRYQPSVWQHEYRSRVRMQAAHPVFDDAIHIAGRIRWTLDWGSSELCIGEATPAFVGETVRSLDILATDPALV